LFIFPGKLGIKVFPSLHDEAGGFVVMDSCGISIEIDIVTRFRGVFPCAGRAINKEPIGIIVEEKCAFSWIVILPRITVWDSPLSMMTLSSHEAIFVVVGVPVAVLFAIQNLTIFQPSLK
jgi:hypothetical protein